MRKSLVLIAAVGLASCGQSRDENPAGTASPDATQAAATPSAPPAESRDPCSLVADAQGLFGTPVTSGVTRSSGTAVCEWKSEDGRICGSLTLFTSGPNVSPDPKVNFAGLTTSLGAFGVVKEVPGIGEEARMVDGGMLGAQLALRTASNAALVGSACRSGPHGQVELVQKLAHEVVGKL